MTVLSPDNYEGLRFLAQEAEEAHLAGDGIRVLHLCRVAFEYVERQSGLKTLGTLAIEDVRWCFALALYWAFGDYECLVIHELLKAIPSRDDARCDHTVLSYVLGLLDNPFSARPTAELLAFPQGWLMSRSAERADIALLTLAVELTWTRDPFGDSWQNVGRTWIDRTEPGSPVAQSLRELLQRLQYQTYLTLGKWPNGCGAGDMPERPPPLAEAYRLFSECDWKALDCFIREQVPRTRIEDPSYLPLFHLIHWTRFLRGGGDSQLLSLSRYELSVSHQPMQVYESLRRRSFLGHSLKLARAQGGGGAGDRAAIFRLALLSEVSALRAWDLIAWRVAVGEQAQAALELAGYKLENRAELLFAQHGVVNSVRALHTDEKDTRFRRAIQLLDTAKGEDRETVVRELLSMHPVEWGDAYTALKLLSDAVPEAMLPDLARWSAELEITNLKLQSQHLSRLAFWGDILGYVMQPSELVAILKPALLHTCQIPMAWSEIYATLVASLTKGPIEVAFGLIDAMVSAPDRGFASERWRIIFNACIERQNSRQESYRGCARRQRGMQNVTIILHAWKVTFQGVRLTMLHCASR